MVELHDRCEFCAEIYSCEGRVEGPPGGLGAERRPMWMSQSFLLFPSLGPLTRGHMLLVPREHITAFGHLREDAYEEAIASMNSARQYLSRFGSPVCFEHGSASELCAGGCGIVHAHMHVLPLSSRLTGLPPIAAADWKPLSEQNWLEGLGKIVRQGASYVYFEDQSSFRYASMVGSLPSQFVRQWIAGQIGIAKWDWRSSDRLTDLAAPMQWMVEGYPPSGFSTLG